MFLTLALVLPDTSDNMQRFVKQVGLSIDRDDEEGSNDGIDLGLRPTIQHSVQPRLFTPSPEILLAFGTTSANIVPGPGSVQQVRGAAAFSLAGGSGSSHGVSSSHGLSIHGMSGHGTFTGRDGSSRHSAGGGGMPRVLSWPVVSSSDGGFAESVHTDEDGLEVFDPACDGVAEDMEAGMLGSPTREPTACYICVERRPDAVVMECGHGGMCFKCAQQLESTSPAQCPVCRKPIQQVLRFERIMSVRSGGSIVGGSGGGIGGAGGTDSGTKDHACSAKESTGGGGDLPVVAIATSSSSSVGIGNASGTGARVGSGSFVRRFSAPDEPAVPSVAGVSGSGIGAGVGVSEDDSHRTASPPAPRDVARRGGASGSGGDAGTFSEEGGWLDPV